MTRPPTALRRRGRSPRRPWLSRPSRARRAHHPLGDPGYLRARVQRRVRAAHRLISVEPLGTAGAHPARKGWLPPRGCYARARNKVQKSAMRSCWDASLACGFARATTTPRGRAATAKAKASHPAHTHPVTDGPVFAGPWAPGSTVRCALPGRPRMERVLAQAPPHAIARAPARRWGPRVRLPIPAHRRRRKAERMTSPTRLLAGLCSCTSWITPSGPVGGAGRVGVTACIAR